MKILIVDDELVSRKKLEKILEKYAVCVSAENGAEALGAFEAAWKDDAPFDLVCLDVSMPDMDGTEVLFEIREKEKQLGVQKEKPAKVLMITSHRDKGTVITSIQAGCDEYLAKPFDRHRVLEIIQKLGLKITFSLI